MKLSPAILNAALNAKQRNSINETPSLLSLSTLSDGNHLEFILSKFKFKLYVYDYDRGFLSDDLIGYANVDLSQLKENV